MERDTFSEISGLFWERNYFAETGPQSWTLVANPGPLVADFHFWELSSYEAFILHVGQEDRFTFFGNPDREITATFVDCRRNSLSLHRKCSIKFSPDPRRVLHIPAGVAAHFSGMMHITVRSEPILYAPEKESEYSVGNDQIRIYSKTTPDDFPVIDESKMVLPVKVLQLILKRQQEMIVNNEPYTETYGIPCGDKIVRFSCS